MISGHAPQPALQLLAATATGLRWLGREVTPGRALYLSAEDEADEVHRRLADIVREHDVTFGDLADLRIAPLAGLDAVLAAPAGRNGQIAATPLWRALEALVADFRPSIIVIDTLADAFAGDEINRVQARQFIGLLRGLALRHGCAVLLLAHPSLTGIASGKGSSGSTGWDNSVRSALYLTRDERAGMTLQELRDIGQARYAAWKAAVSAPPRELTRAEKRAMLEAALHERARIKRELLAADPTDIADVLARPGVPQDELPVGG